MRSSYLGNKVKVNPSLERNLEKGWAFDLLIQIESVLWGRWDYWLAEAWALMQVPESPIPRMDFESAPNKKTVAMLEKALGHLQDRGAGYYQALRYVLEWLVWSFGDPSSEEPRPIVKNASGILYQAIDIGQMLLYPYDYPGFLLTELRHGKRSGFYPTPHTVVNAICQILSIDVDMKTKTVCDPCVGTGRMLLEASNYSLRLYGQDIDSLVLLGTKVNLYLYAPWGARPLPDEIYEKAKKMNWLVTLKPNTDVSTFESDLQSVDATRTSDPVPLDDDEIVITVTGPDDLDKLLTDNTNVNGVFPDSEMGYC